MALALLGLSAAASLLGQSALTPEPVVAPPPLIQAAPENVQMPPEYTIGPDDVLQIRVWKEPDVSVDRAVVRGDGKISVPLVGEVFATGLSTNALADLLTSKFKRYINTPVVTVIAVDVNSRRIYLIGGVGNPGSMPLLDGMTALDAIAEAGGLTDYAKRNKIYILRETPQGRAKIDYDYKAVLSGKNPEADVLLRPGDRSVAPI